MRLTKTRKKNSTDVNNERIKTEDQQYAKEFELAFQTITRWIMKAIFWSLLFALSGVNARIMEARSELRDNDPLENNTMKKFGDPIC